MAQKNPPINGAFIYKLGGAAALGAVLIGMVEILITFLPGGNTTQVTVLDWFRLFQQNQFMGLRDLGLLNIFFNLMAILTSFALYTAHRETPYKPQAALVMLISFLGIGIFFATNRAFSMLALSRQYLAATTEAQRAALEAAGLSLLSVGQSHTPGTFLAFFFSELAGVLFAAVILKSKLLGQGSAYVGILGFGMLLVFEIFSSFVAGLSALALTLAMFGGLLSMAWYILLARKFFQLGQNPAKQA